MNIDFPKSSYVPQLRALWKEAFGDTDEFLDKFFTAAYSADRCRCCTENGEVIAALYWFDCSYGDEKIAYIYAVATAKAHRGRGICKRLMEDTHAYLSAHAYGAAMLVPGSEGLFAFYERLGYEKCGGIVKFECAPSSFPEKLRRIDAKEYALQRRRLLPTGSVIQENENLDFLQKISELYAGDDLIFACHREGNKLYVAELLGDAERGAGIVSALGCSTGSFRAPGKEHPFAMYFALDGEKNGRPSYFGLAFD